MNEQTRRLINVNELSKILGVPRSWIYQRTWQGQTAIPHIKMGKYVRFETEKVIAFFANRGQFQNLKINES